MRTSIYSFVVATALCVGSVQAQTGIQQGHSPSHPLTDYAGIYEHPAYGRLEIAVASNTLQVRFDQFGLASEHFHFDTFEIDAGRNMVPLEGRVQFLMNSAGKIDRVTIPLEPSLPAAVFNRVETVETDDG